MKKTVREEIEELKAKLKKISEDMETERKLHREYLDRQDKLLTDFDIIINGSEKYGVKGLKRSQQEDNNWQHKMLEKLSGMETSISTLETKIQDEGKSIMEKVDAKIGPVILRNNAWDTAVDFVTNPKVWGVFLFVMILAVALLIMLKVKAVEALNSIVK